MEKSRAHIIISGLVQGVCFRYETQAKANALGLAGWVMNRRDGRVEAVFEGNKKSVERMVEWCRQGPEGAVVKNTDIKWETYEGELVDFSILV